MGQAAGAQGNGGRLPVAFFERDAIDVARELIGAMVVRRTGGRELRARIVETEAYVGEHDLASHSSRGRTARTEVMFGPGGRAYIYFIYGMHEMFNVVTGKAGDAQAVLLRAAEPVSGWEEGVNLSGPGRLARGLQITRSLNGVEVTGERLWFEKRRGRVRVGVSARIGVDYAGAWKEELLRFFDEESAAVSGRKGRARK
jgi:DNA-3-methyladenine glycosylase